MNSFAHTIFRNYCIFWKNIVFFWKLLRHNIRLGVSYKWIRFEAFLFLFELFQIIRELSVWGCLEGDLYTKCIIIWFCIWLLQFWNKCVVILRVSSDCSAYCSTATRFVQISRQMVTPTLLRPRTTTEVARVQCKSWTASLRWATVEKAVTGTSTCRRRMCVMTPGTSCGRPANINKSWPIRRPQL